MIHKIHQDRQWKKTVNGRYIELYSSSQNLQFATPPIIFIGGVHGDEPEGINLAHSLLDYLKEVSHKNNTYKKEWILIPCLNPEGFEKKQRVNGNKVDLNRNFPSTDWSPEFKQDRYFPGPTPGSEIETQAVIELIQTYKPELVMHFHSWKPMIIHNANLGKHAALIFSEVSGYPLQDDIGYPTPGSLGQYGYLNCNTGVVCIEESENVPKEESFQRFKKGFQKLLDIQ